MECSPSDQVGEMKFIPFLPQITLPAQAERGTEHEGMFLTWLAAVRQQKGGLNHRSLVVVSSCHIAGLGIESGFTGSKNKPDNTTSFRNERRTRTKE
jgi:hypothetical protein